MTIFNGKPSHLYFNLNTSLHSQTIHWTFHFIILSPRFTNKEKEVKKIAYTLLGMSLIQGALAFNEIERAWMRISDPLIMSTTFNRQFAELPLSGNSNDPAKLWSSDYWARNKGGINYRWNGSPRTGFNLVSPTKAQAMSMTEAQLSKLAPSEKWDLFIGRYDYPTKKEVANYASPSRPSWEGICDGWSGAALNHHEPTPKVLTNPDGVKIPFGSSDIKGLLSWYYAKKYSGGYAQMGLRCRGDSSSGDRCVHDMNAGAFHIVLTNKLGRDGGSFIADMDRGEEVWNHLAFSFTSTVKNLNLSPRSTSAPGTVKVARVRSVVKYVYLLRSNTWAPVLGTSGQRLTSRTYEYYLDLNASGQIIGGDWISTQRPDFLWLERKVPSFGGSFSKLGELLNDGQAPTVNTDEAPVPIPEVL